MAFDKWTTVEDLRARQKEIEQSLHGLDTEFAGKQFPGETRELWNELNAEHDEIAETIKEKETRERRLREVAQNPENIDGPRTIQVRGGELDRGESAPPHVLASREQGLRAIERNKHALTSEAGDRLEETIRQRDPQGIGARYLAAVGDPAYNSAFGKLVMDPTTGHLRFGPEEVAAVRRVSAVMAERAMSVGVDASGGFGVPFTLDPTILLSSSGVLNPIRQVATVRTITTDKWKGVSSTGVTAAYAAEATEASDNAPTLVQPVADTAKGQAFVPFSIEVGMDYPSLQAELARLFADARDVVDATQMLTGSGTDAPKGLLTGLTTSQRVLTDVAATLDIDDVWDVKGNAPPRFVGGARFAGNPGMFDRIFRFTPSGSTTEPQAMPTRRSPVRYPEDRMEHDGQHHHHRLEGAHPW